jgi:hypothetical protein
MIRYYGRFLKVDKEGEHAKFLVGEEQYKFSFSI